MAASWRAGVLQQAEQVWDALRRLASSGLEFLNAELGLALEVEPQVLSAVTAGFLLLLLLATVCAAAACGAALRRRRRRTNVRVGTKTRESNDRVNVNDAEIATDSGKIPPVKTGKPEEPKKKNKKKATEKQKTQPNGRTVPEVREEIKAVQELPKQAAVPTPPQPQPPPQPPADNKADKAKKNKKKPKPEVKQNQNVLTTEVKEPDEGAWETKISNREKRQQRRKEKGPGDDSGSPGGGNHVGQQVEQPVVKVSITAKKNKAESLNSKIEKAEKRNAIIAPASTWNPVTSGGWAEISAKPPTQVSAPDGEKWSVGKKTSGHRNSEPLAWGQETDGSWTGTVMGDRIKAELNPVSFSMVGLNPSAKDPAAELGKWDSLNTADNEWSGSNGLEAVDPSSDWNAPSELWGNFEEPKAAKPAAQETPVSQPARLQDSDDDKEKGDSGSKSKRKKKKKKKPEEENAVSQVNTENLPTAADIKTHPHVLQEEPTKQNVTQPSSQKKTDQNREPPKQAQKKKARRET